MDGLLNFAHADNTYEGTVTEADIRKLARKLFDAGNENAEIYVLVSPEVKEQIDELYKANYNYNHAR